LAVVGPIVAVPGGDDDEDDNNNGDDEYGSVDGMRIDKGNQSTQRKPAPVPLFPPQIPHGVTWDHTQTSTVGNQQVTA
jgi:hypothetical protein